MLIERPEALLSALSFLNSSFLNSSFLKTSPPYNISTRNQHIESRILVCYSNRSLLEGENLGKVSLLLGIAKVPPHILGGILIDFFLIN